MDADASSRCPNCGYCPNCGQARWPRPPYPPSWPYPWPYGINPYWWHNYQSYTPPTVTFVGTTSSGIPRNAIPGAAS